MILLQEFLAKNLHYVSSTNSNSKNEVPLFELYKFTKIEYGLIFLCSFSFLCILYHTKRASNLNLLKLKIRFCFIANSRDSWQLHFFIYSLKHTNIQISSNVLQYICCQILSNKKIHVWIYHAMGCCRIYWVLKTSSGVIIYWLGRYSFHPGCIMPKETERFRDFIIF